MIFLEYVIFSLPNCSNSMLYSNSGTISLSTASCYSFSFISRDISRSRLFASEFYCYSSSKEERSRLSCCSEVFLALAAIDLRCFLFYFNLLYISLVFFLAWGESSPWIYYDFTCHYSCFIQISTSRSDPALLNSPAKYWPWKTSLIRGPRTGETELGRGLWE